MRTAAILLFSCCVLSGGCGYSTDSLMPPGVRSIALGIFGNETFYRFAEITYTREVARELVRRARVDLRDPDEADAILSGRIVTVPRSTLLEDNRDQILEGGVVVVIEVELRDARTGALIEGPFTVSRRAEFIVPRGETLATSIDEALRDAARDTVHRLQISGFREG